MCAQTLPFLVYNIEMNEALRTQYNLKRANQRFLIFSEISKRFWYAKNIKND